jgi:hypothetical protein
MWSWPFHVRARRAAPIGFAPFIIHRGRKKMEYCFHLCYHASHRNKRQPRERPEGLELPRFRQETHVRGFSRGNQNRRALRTPRHGCDEAFLSRATSAARFCLTVVADPCYKSVNPKRSDRTRPMSRMVEGPEAIPNRWPRRGKASGQEAAARRVSRRLVVNCLRAL